MQNPAEKNHTHLNHSLQRNEERNSSVVFAATQGASVGTFNIRASIRKVKTRSYCVLKLFRMYFQTQNIDRSSGFKAKI